ncbi:MAG: carbohydrate ABC transporter permease [Nitrospiraceae bacterium]|nr:carbohydrate ABC transporter permease [Nitrospiraceae bacterium]
MKSAELERTRSLSKLTNYVLIYGILTLATAFAFIPVLWGLSTSLKPVTEVNSIPPTWLPNNLTFENYEIGVLKSKFLLYFKNTVIVIVFSLILSLLLASHAAWVVARRNFFGKNILLFLMWATIMVPGISIIVPLYLISIELHIYDTYLVLVLVFSAWAVPTLVWLLRGFVSGIPADLEESAKIDGCSDVGAFYRITVPLLPPGLIAGSMMVFVLVWNEFLIPYSLVISDDHRIIQVGLYGFITETGIEWGPMMAALIGSLIPIVVLYAFLQRYFIQGLTGGALKQ